MESSHPFFHSSDEKRHMSLPLTARRPGLLHGPDCVGNGECREHSGGQRAVSVSDTVSTRPVYLHTLQAVGIQLPTTTTNAAVNIFGLYPCKAQREFL